MLKVALPVVAIASGASAGILTIDDYTQGPFSLTLDAGTVVGQQDIAVLGAQRDYAVGAASNPFQSDLTVSVDPDVGLVYSAGPGVGGFAAFQYDGSDDVEDDDLPFDPDGGLSIDLSGFDRIDVEFLFLDIPMGVTIELANVGKGGILASSELEQIVGDVAVPTVFSFDFDDFVGDVDLTDVNAITITYNSQEDAPAARDFVVRSVTIVPAPGALALLGLGALTIRRRR